MSDDRTRPPTAPERTSYHHGDLRRVLLEVGHRLLEETDASHLSLRAIAREAGVSRAAPYHHFADYVLFAFENPHHYRLMFSGEWSDRDRHPELNREADATYGALGSALGGLEASGTRKGGRQGKGLAQALALGAWSLVHGLAMLLIDGRVGEAEMTAAEVEGLAREVTRVLGRGLAG
jgi:hypothetical protein